MTHDVIREELLGSITQAVRFLSLEQIARTWCEQDLLTASRLIEELEAQDLINVESLLVHPELRVAGPEFRWSGTGDVPDFAPVAYRLRNRWNQQKTMTRLVFPTRKACEKFGGTRVRSRLSELSHDLMMASVYLRVHPHLHASLHWISGDSLRSDGELHNFGGNVPDAVLKNDLGQVVKIIEGGGRYHRGKLESLHQQYRHMAYEIW